MAESIKEVRRGTIQLIMNLADFAHFQTFPTISLEQWRTDSPAAEKAQIDITGSGPPREPEQGCLYRLSDGCYIDEKVLQETSYGNQLLRRWDSKCGNDHIGSFVWWMWGTCFNLYPTD